MSVSRLITYAGLVAETEFVAHKNKIWSKNHKMCRSVIIVSSLMRPKTASRLSLRLDAETRWILVKRTHRVAASSGKFSQPPLSFQLLLLLTWLKRQCIKAISHVVVRMHQQETFIYVHMLTPVKLVGVAIQKICIPAFEKRGRANKV